MRSEAKSVDEKSEISDNDAKSWRKWTRRDIFSLGPFFALTLHRHLLQNERFNEKLAKTAGRDYYLQYDQKQAMPPSRKSGVAGERAGGEA